MTNVRISVLSVLLLGAPTIAAERVEYLRDVKPVLKERCFACHGALKQESGLRLDAASLIRKGGDGGAAISIGKSAESLLIERVSAEDESERMPPEGKPLTDQQIAMLKIWIDQGAKAPADERPEENPRQHWAFQCPIRAPVPQDVHNEWNRNPIDAFVASGHEKHGLKPLSLVDRRLLLRRVYLDLIGLPPTRAEIQAFLADKSDGAYERVVDRLLESPHYGERWGRHWMDIWRYTDWFGLGAQLRYSQKHIWHWRDWIIESLNDDKGYDRMILEMLAADEIAPTDRDALRATGFLARTYFLFNRTTWLDDTIEHTSKAMLGLTMNCTKCHDHKYDPISQVDYYRFRAIFEPYQVRLDQWPGEIDLEKNGLPRVFDAHPEAPTHLHIRGDEKNLDKSRVLTPSVPAVLAFDEFKVTAVSLPAEAHAPSLQSYVLDDHLRAAEQVIEKSRAALSAAKKQLAEAERRSRIRKNSDDQNAPRILTNSATTFLKDDFSKANTEIWETGPGQWKYESGKLVQSKTGVARAYLRSQKDHPTDFQATLKFKTTGGEKWRSVGLCFDVAGGREKLVYLSAVSPGSKLHVCYNSGAGHVYPPDGKQDREVKLNEPYELTISVRGPLVNVAVNGQHALAYQLPVKRETGRIDLVAFDAAAEFDLLEIRQLPADVKLVQAGKTASNPQQPMTVAEAKLTIAVAEKSLATAELRPAALKAARAADVARHSKPPSQIVEQLIEQAALATRKHELAKADEAVAHAEQKLASANDKTKKQLTDQLKKSQTNLDKARKAVESPGTKYTSLTASLKALEGPAESDASRRMPYPKTSTGRRTALARWITDRQNPLTARVAVNHIWLRHFGQPLVETVTDFGRRAKKPTQNELLDWLAIELMENNWSMKHLHRLMVTSRTYRLKTSTVDVDENTKQFDPENHYYWRRKPVRMESQVIRDSLLQLAGVLNPTMGGPTIDPKKDDTVYRRSIYFTHSRDDQHKFLTMFDDADILRCYRRSESIVPQQALTLANSKLALSMSRKIAAQLQQKLGDVSDDKFIEAAFELILASRPTADELKACRESIDETKTALAKRNHAQALNRARENFVHALVNHNDFITIR